MKRINFNWLFICGHIGPDLIWFRMGTWGAGIVAKNTPALYSERCKFMIYHKIPFSKWRCGFLKAAR